VITYRTDLDLLSAIVPELLEVVGDTVHYVFILMQDSTAFRPSTLPTGPAGNSGS
jgi:acetoacetate decarboxylase